MIKEVKILEVHVDKGMKHGQRITFTGEADQAPGVEPGDIVLLLQEKEHEVISFLFFIFASEDQKWVLYARYRLDQFEFPEATLNIDEVVKSLG